MGDRVGVAILSLLCGLKPPSPMGRSCPSYRIFMPQSPRWEASLRQSLPVMLFGSNNICSCSKSSGGSLRPGRGRVFSEGRTRDPVWFYTPQMPNSPRGAGVNPEHPPGNNPSTSPIAWGRLGDRGWRCPGLLL